jgi:hypothetical protein
MDNEMDQDQDLELALEDTIIEDPDAEEGNNDQAAEPR